MGVTTITKKTKDATAPSQGWSLGAQAPQYLQQEPQRAPTTPRQGAAPPQALSSSRASLKGCYPTLSPHLRLPPLQSHQVCWWDSELTSPAQATILIRCLPYPLANFHLRA